jgi:Mg2+/Co2+ transporter CorB
VLYIFGIRHGDSELQSLNRDELRVVVHEAGKRISSRYQQMLIGILDLENVSVDDVMVPRNEIIGIDLDDDISDIEMMIVNSQHTRLPVFRDSVDNIVGVLHLRRLANLTKQTFDKAQLEKILDEPYFVPEGTPLSMQLVQFQRRRLRIAMVVDEYGDIQGIVTLEDILEEIVGEFTTDPADGDDDAVRDGNDAWLVNGAANIRELNRAQNWELPTDGPKTINGLIVEQLENIPKPLTRLMIDSYQIEIIESDNTRIHSVRISPKTPQTATIEDD